MHVCEVRRVIILIILNTRLLLGLVLHNATSHDYMVWRTQSILLKSEGIN